MDRHEGVSCDYCQKTNFKGKRYKCLICLDYDLCSVCYEADVSTPRHNASHPMQCILTRADHELYYGGETLQNPEVPQSFTCPYCGRMGFTEGTLQEHIIVEHRGTDEDVICPVCAASPGGDPNVLIEDVIRHFALEHRDRTAFSREMVSFLDEPVGRAQSAHNMRRPPAPANPSPTNPRPNERRETQAIRIRRNNVHCTVFSSAGLTTLSGRDAADPIAELISQLSGSHRSSVNLADQLHNLQFQLQMDALPINNPRNMDKLPKRVKQGPTTVLNDDTSTSGATTLQGLTQSPILTDPKTEEAAGTETVPPLNFPTPKFALTAAQENLGNGTNEDNSATERSHFVNDLFMSMMSNDDEESKDENEEDDSADDEDADGNNKSREKLKRFLKNLTK